MVTKFLLPGETYFGSNARYIVTLLGSCVAVVMWHPQHKLGGMCHFVLPFGYNSDNKQYSPGRYAPAAINFLLNSCKEWQTKANEYRIGVYGGGHNLAKSNNDDTPPLIGLRNIQAALQILAAYGIQPHESKMGDSVYRRVCLDCHTGKVDVRESAFDLQTN